MSMWVLIYICAFLAFFSVVEMVKRFRDLRPEFTRKVVHIGSCLLIFTMPWFLNKWEVMLLALAFIVLLLFTRVYGLFSAVQGVKRKTIGEFTFPMGAALSAYFFLPEQPHAFQVGFLVLAFSDSLAEFVGRRMPMWSANILGGAKSVGGSVAFLFSTLIILIVGVHWWGVEVNYLKLAMGCAAITAVEFSQVFGIDNLFIPVSTCVIWEWMSL